MKRKSLREKINDSIDHLALGAIAVIGIGITLLRGKIANRFKKRYRDSNEYDDFSCSGLSNANQRDSSNTDRDKR